MSFQRDRMRIPAGPVVLDYARRLGLRRTFYRGTYVLVNKAIAVSILDCVQLRREDVNSGLTDPAGRYECRFLEPDTCWKPNAASSQSIAAAASR